MRLSQRAFKAALLIMLYVFAFSHSLDSLSHTLSLSLSLSFFHLSLSLSFFLSLSHTSYRQEPLLHLPFEFLQILIEIDNNVSLFRHAHATMVLTMLLTHRRLPSSLPISFSLHPSLPFLLRDTLEIGADVHPSLGAQDDRGPHGDRREQRRSLFEEHDRIEVREKENGREREGGEWERAY